MYVHNTLVDLSSLPENEFDCWFAGESKESEISIAFEGLEGRDADLYDGGETFISSLNCLEYISMLYGFPKSGIGNIPTSMDKQRIIHLGRRGGGRVRRREEIYNYRIAVRLAQGSESNKRYLFLNFAIGGIFMKPLHSKI